MKPIADTIRYIFAGALSGEEPRYRHEGVILWLRVEQEIISAVHAALSTQETGVDAMVCGMQEEIDHAFETGFMQGIQCAIDVCRRRANRGLEDHDDRLPQSIRNEASKCAAQIEHEALQADVLGSAEIE